MADIKPIENRKYDVVLFGATGFTGNLISKHLIKTPLPPNFRWAITGRTPEKLEKIYGELEKLVETGKGLKENLPTILDFATYSPASIIADTRVVCSVVGPSTLHAEQFLKLAVENGTGWVDLSGEPQWHRDMIGKYGKRARETRAVIIPSCGMDCVPSDIGALLLAAQVGGELGKVDAVYEEVEFTPSTGTLSSLIAPYTKYPYETEVGGSTGFMRNAYYLCPDVDHSGLPKQEADFEVRSVTPNLYQTGSTRKGPTKPVSSGILSTNGLIENLNRTIVIRTSGLQSQQPAKSSKVSFSHKTFHFREYKLFPTVINQAITYFIALLHTIQFTKILPYILSFALAQRVVKSVIRLRGENTGPTKEMQENNHLRLRMIGASDKDPRKGYMQLETFKDPGYAWTAEVIGEFAVFLSLKMKGEAPKIGEEGRKLLPGLRDEEGDLIFEGKERKGGFWTTACLGVGIARWLNERTSGKWETGWQE